MTTFDDAVYYNGGTPVGGGLPVGADGRVFYVDPSSSVGLSDPVGSDSNDGLSPSKALKTLQAAIDKCDDWRGDLIICKAGNQTVTTAVTFDVKGITVMAEPMGLPTDAAGERFMIYGSHTDGPAAIISYPCKIIGMGFCGSEAAGGSLEIDGTTGGFEGGNFVHLLNCRFSHWGIAKAYALILQGTGDVRVENCYFDGYTAGWTTAAIECQLATASGTWTTDIVGCKFVNPTTYALKMATSSVPVRGIVEGNRLIGAGKFFDDNDVDGSWGFYGNYLPTATDTSSYADTVTNLKTAGYKFAGNNYSE